MKPQWTLFMLAAYRALLALYPCELRNKYGHEMLGILEEQMHSAFDTRSLLYVSAFASMEVLTIAIPARLFSRTTLVSAVAIASTAAIFLSLTAVMQDQALAMWINKKFLFDCR